MEIPLNTFEMFPEKLRKNSQWVLWKFKLLAGTEKPTKVLYSPKGFQASVIESNSWGTFEECKNILLKSTENIYNGIGYVFTRGVIGIDLDNCILPDGNIRPWAQTILNTFESYTEFSPSRKGLHLILEGDVDLKGRKKDWIENGEKVGIECYSKSRYFTVTGNVFRERSNLKQFDGPMIFDWYNKNFEKHEKNIPLPALSPSSLPDEKQIIDFMRKARNGEKFKSLFDNGDFKSVDFPSQSEADMSLVGSLMFFTRNNTTLVDRIFRQSKLYRKKWERLDYREELFKKCYNVNVMDWSRPTECDEPEDELVIRLMSEVKPKNVSWLWYSRLAKGKLALWQGSPGCGKSQVTIYVASVISNGGKFMDDFQCEEGQVMFITAEDEASDTLKPRLMAQNAKMTNILELQWIKKRSGKMAMFNFSRYMEQFRTAVRKLPNLKLIVVDPISAFLGEIDGNTTGEVRGLLNELKNVAEERSCAVILINHHNKSSGQSAGNRSSGSHAFAAAARMQCVFGPKPIGEEETKIVNKEFLMAPIKNNLTPDPTTRMYTIESTNVIGDEGETIFTSLVKWQGISEIESQEIVDYMPGKNKKGAGAPRSSAVIVEDIIKDVLKGRLIASPNEVALIRSRIKEKEISDNTFKKTYRELGFRAISTEDGKWGWEQDELTNLF